EAAPVDLVLGAIRWKSPHRTKCCRGIQLCQFKRHKTEQTCATRLWPIYGKITPMTRQIPERVQQKLINLPDSPGVYQMLNGEGKVIYVGKASVLRNRVRSYFHASAQHTPKTLALVEEIQDITWWVTGTELEALVLENELIKRYKP